MSSIKELKALGLIVSDEPIFKEITVKIGEDDLTMGFYVRRLGIGEFEEGFLNIENDASRTAKALSTAILLGEGGKEKLPLDVARKIHPAAAKAMLDEVIKENSPKKS